MPARRVLFVDDEPAIRTTLRHIFAAEGFDVTTAATVAEALQLIATTKFDILIADLNIGEPGDGFTVVSALRRTYPDALALILTGYPAFEAALRAIREQVDDFLVKPVHPNELVARVKSFVRTHPHHHVAATKKVSEVIREEKGFILNKLLTFLRVLADDEEKTILSDKQFLDCLPDVIEELCVRVSTKADRTSAKATEVAKHHGRTRFEQGFGLPFILDESTQLRQSIIDAVHRNLLHVDLSTLFLDLGVVSLSLDEQLRLSISEYARLALGETERPKH